MQKVKIITDSNSGITQKEGKELGISVVPMPFSIGLSEYLEDINITQQAFYVLLENNADVKTSQPSRIYLEELWDNLLTEYDELVYIPMSAGLSTTCENATTYAKNYGGKVQVVNNRRISLSQKESVYEAIEMAKQGKNAAEIKDYLESTAAKSSIYIILDTLKYIKKGGRISPAAALLADTFRVKPVLYTRGDAFRKFTTAMSIRQAERKVIEQLKCELENEFKQDFEKGNMVISLAYTKSDEEALRFKQDIIKEFPSLTFRFVDPLSLSVSYHIGPNALGISLSVNNYLDK